MTVQLIDSVRWEQAQAETLDFLKAIGVQGVLMRVPRLRRRGDPRRGLPPDAPPRGGARPAA